MERFSKRHFLEADEDQRKELCEELSDMLSLRLRSAPSFHAGVLDCIGQLRSEGHDSLEFRRGRRFRAVVSRLQPTQWARLGTHLRYAGKGDCPVVVRRSRRLAYGKHAATDWACPGLVDTREQAMMT